MSQRIKDFLCGNYPGQNHYSMWMGCCFGMNTRRGRFAHWIAGIACNICLAPNRFRFRLADQLARMASGLRREKVTVFGIWDESRGNRAADLVDRIEISLIGKIDPSDYADEIRDDLHELASIAEATRWRNNEIFKKRPA
jgi:hypothetical protein